MEQLSFLDQPVRVTSDEQSMFDGVDEAVSRALLIGDPKLISDYAMSLRRGSIVRAYALAKLLYKTNQVWAMFRVDGTIEDFAYEAMGVASDTVKKYVRMWDSIFENPDISDETKQLLMGRNIRDTLLLTAAAREGSLTDEQLRRAASASDSAAVRDIVRGARGEATSSSSAVRLEVVIRDDHEYPLGTLLVRRNGEMEVFGILYVDDPNELIQKAISRTIDASGIREV